MSWLNGANITKYSNKTQRGSTQSNLLKQTQNYNMMNFLQSVDIKHNKGVKCAKIPDISLKW